MARSSIEFLLHPPSPTLPSIIKDKEEKDLKTSDLPFLCLPSPSLSSTSSVLEPIEPSCTSSPSLSPLLNSMSLDSSSSSKFLLPLPTRSRSLSNASSTSSLLSYLSDDSCNSTNRKRGRPPNSPSQQPRENYTFVTPRVCNVKSQKQEKQQLPRQPKAKKKVHLHWSKPKINHNINIQQVVFTSKDLDASIPKKRGRKPKTEMAGNFCFIWRDLTAKRSANKKKQLLARTDKR